ncbi:FadR/GntR family transcriptional regulator [Nonomuraea pusilla]|uniref:FadR/GntR family transcriptional regulator n=1 Tax=Nonomuraea pusilla TaxID=46177 RepID=UPI0006E15E68|nr:FadR/GntR family transcriptional regulator [Nonomuraea pusilla]
MAVTDAAIDRIKQMIISGELAPGDRLPKEADLAERLGLSRNSLREAVRALALVNVLDVRQGDGTYVTSLEPRLLLDTMSFVLDLHRDDTVLQFFEVRRILEPAATAMATELMTEADVEELRLVLESLPAEPTVDELVTNDLRFHQRIAQGSGNSVLCSFIESLSGPTTRARAWRGLTQEDAVQRTRDQHTAIYEAIAGRRPEVARAWATAHIADVESWIRRALT